jgi:hypothetical protein
MLRVCVRLFSVLCVLVFASHARADLTVLLPDDWFTRAPTPQRISGVQAAAIDEGWPAVATRLFAGSIRAYELRQEDAAAAWYHVARWCDLMGQSQKKETREWWSRSSVAGLINEGFDKSEYESRPDEAIARLISEETRGWLLSDRAFSEMFFNLVTPYDDLSRVVQILQELREPDVRKFTDYSQLALAIALVYDVPPPSYWPHWQVSDAVLPRRLPEPLAAFDFLIKSDQNRLTLQRLGGLSASELKFAVDLAAPFDELIWAQRSVRVSLSDLEKSYLSVRYRQDRIEQQQYQWPDKDYALPTILKEGGICVDQAYFATQAGKARGVPTLLFSGAGREGRHAWFGYLGMGRKWVLDAGRYADQAYVTGEAFDPQTWLPMSDHELGFLSEDFRRLSPYRQSWQQQVFAELYLRLGNKIAAAGAARKAVNFERRNLAAWELLIDVSADAPARTREGLLREASQAMQRYPDLNGRFIGQLAASLRARGEVSAAEFEERSLVRRGQNSGRTDVSVDQAVKLMQAASPTDQVRVYKQVSQQYGRGTGIDFYDRVTSPLLQRMFAENRRMEAMQIIEQTRTILKPEFGSQFDTELTEMAAKANAK